MPEPIPQPPVGRVVEAFVAAPVVAAAALGLTAGVVAKEPGAGLAVGAFGLFVVGLPATLVLGLPLYLLLRRRVRPTPANCAAAGALVGGAPVLALHLYLFAQDLARNAGEAMVLPGLAVAAGALGGVVFWTFVRWPGVRTTGRPGPTPERASGGGDDLGRT